jgi:hypothetical protein
MQVVGLWCWTLKGVWDQVGVLKPIHPVHNIGIDLLQNNRILLEIVKSGKFSSTF